MSTVESIQIKKNNSPLGFTFANFSGSFSSTGSSAAATKIKPGPTKFTCIF